MTLSPRAIEAAVTKFNDVINDPVMEPCPRCDGKGYHHGFGPGGVEPDWCENCGGNQYNIRPGEEKRAMEAALTAALAVDGLCLVPKEPSNKMIEAGCDHNPTQWNEGTDIGFAADVANDVYRAMIAAASTGDTPREDNKK